MQHEQADIWKPSLLAGAVFGFLSGIPLVGALNCACCSLIVGAGFLASFLLIRASTVPVSYGRAALTGMLSGVFAVPFCLLAEVLFSAVTGRDFRSDLDQAMEQAQGVVGGGEQAAQIIAGIGMVGIMVIMFAVLLLLWAPFGTLGGVIGRALFERRTPPASGQPSGPPAPPTWTPPAPPPYQGPGTPTMTS